MLLKTVAVEGGVGRTPLGAGSSVAGGVEVVVVAVGAVGVGAEFCELAELLELGWPFWPAVAPLPQATLRDRTNMSMPKRSFFI
jgi:hypothetical protein